MGIQNHEYIMIAKNVNTFLEWVVWCEHTKKYHSVSGNRSASLKKLYLWNKRPRQGSNTPQLFNSILQIISGYCMLEQTYHKAKRIIIKNK